MDPTREARDARARDRRVTAIAAILFGAAVSFVLGMYARMHVATGTAPISLGFNVPGEMKIWFTRVAALLGLFQVASGLRINGQIRLPHHLPKWFRFVHRGSGTLAVLLAVPVAYDCVAAFGYHLSSARIALHGAAGLVLFGAFAAKVVAVQRRRRAAWLIPAVGAILFLALSTLWLTSHGWPLSVY